MMPLSWLQFRPRLEPAAAELSTVAQVDAQVPSVIYENRKSAVSRGVVVCDQALLGVQAPGTNPALECDCLEGPIGRQPVLHVYIGPGMNFLGAGFGLGKGV